MKYLVISLFAVTLLVAGAALAADAGDAAKAPKKAIELKHGTSKRMHVMFNHATHKDVACEQCHHDTPDPAKPYVSCTNDDCHATPGPRERDTMSMFVAYHAKDTDRSCYGCHKQMAKDHPEFSGCRPCHMSPQAKKDAAAAKKK
ncbi:formate dehydrogenase subunit gamma cytochrome c-553 [Nitratidesulfovibrio sp. D1]|uniref:formate dehydrogenase subunit gamma cytochrome c-553 n=1 Tax=Nitratidesulfovibrio sp. D1 TaxID=3440151 RepID=UPI003EBFFD6C